MIMSRLENDVRLHMGLAIAGRELDLPTEGDGIPRFSGELTMESYGKCFPDVVDEFAIYVATRESGTENKLRMLERKYLAKVK